MARFSNLVLLSIAVALLNVSLTLGEAARKAPVAGTLRKNVTRTRKERSSTRVVHHPKVLSDEDSTIPIETFTPSASSESQTGSVVAEPRNFIKDDENVNDGPFPEEA
jgi:hypothetical protein